MRAQTCWPKNRSSGALLETAKAKERVFIYAHPHSPWSQGTSLDTLRGKRRDQSSMNQNNEGTNVGSGR